MLERKELGVFILVLANALSRAEIQQPLSARLRTRFTELKQQLDKLPANQLEQIPADDLSVFRALCDMDYDHLTLARSRLVSGWQLQFNPLRSLRPARNSAQKITQMHQPFQHDSFHFNKPFLRKEILWEGELAATAVRILYNKFPFADFHGLLLVEAQQCRPQHLNLQDCNKIQAVLTALAHLPGIGLAYNSLGAYASVNHQHWQLFLSDQHYPIEHTRWKHNSGTECYPLPVECFSNVTQAWSAINQMQQSDQSFNLFIRPNKTWLIKRKRQGEYQHSRWTGGFAWSEVAGNIMTTGLEDYLSLDATSIQTELQKLSPE